MTPSPAFYFCIGIEWNIELDMKWDAERDIIDWTIEYDIYIYTYAYKLKYYDP